MSGIASKDLPDARWVVLLWCFEASGTVAGTIELSSVPGRTIVEAAETAASMVTMPVQVVSAVRL